ncbi:hypothetical protein [Kaarinaea lacus]
MSNLLSNPAIQSGVIPLVVAIIVALVLKRFGGFWSGLSFGIAYYLSVYLAAGFQFFPLTSTRKILILGIIAIALGLIVDSNKIKIKHLFLVTAILGALASLWMIWPVLVRQEGLSLFLMLVPALAYTGWLTASTHKLRLQTDQGAMVALALGLGTGISAILGASALIGQLGMAIGAIAGAFLLLSLFNQNVKSGSTFMLPIGLLSGLLGIGAVIYASLPWYCLIPLAAIPLTTYIQLPQQLSKIKFLLLLAVFTLPFPIIAIVLTWVSTSSSESMY